MQGRLINMISTPKKSFLFLLLVFFFTGQFAYPSSGDIAEHKMEIFSGGQKVGSSKTVIERSSEGVYIKEHSLMDVTVMGKRGTIRIRSSYKLRNRNVDRFSYEVVSESVDLEIEGERKKDKLIIKNKKGKQRIIDYDKKRNYIVPALLPEKLVSEEMKEGDRFTFYIFDPVTLYTGGNADNLKANVRIGSTEKVSTDSGNYVARKVVVNYLGTDSYIWITREGLKVKEYIPPGFTSYIDNSDTNDKTVSGSFNISEETAIPVEKKIERPRDINQLKLLISGIDPSDGLDIHDGYRQFLSGNKLVIKNVNTGEISSTRPATGKELKKYLEASNLIDTDDKGITEKASEITGDEKDSFRKAVLINEWVYRNVEKVPLMSIPESTEVLTGMQGDCNEHAVLFTALARASEIPTKVIMGLVYMDGKFRYHAWNEVFTDQWISVDPTLGQIPTDATHIKLLEGDISRSPEIIRVVGRMRLDVLYYD